MRVGYLTLLHAGCELVGIGGFTRCASLSSADQKGVGTRYFVIVLILDSTIKLSRYYSGYS